MRYPMSRVHMQTCLQTSEEEKGLNSTNKEREKRAHSSNSPRGGQLQGPNKMKEKEA